MRLLGLAPKGVFSGFEKSFFEAIREQGVTVDDVEVEDAAFRAWCTLASFRPRRGDWGRERDRMYHTSVQAFRRKSNRAAALLTRHRNSHDAVYQVGALWNPVRTDSNTRLVLQVDYTSLLSKKRGSEWKRRDGPEQDYWVEQENLLYRRACVVLTTTENARQSVLRDYGVSPDHVVRVGGGVSAPYDRLEPERHPAYDSRSMLFVGKGFQGKGLDTILQALSLVREDVPDATLTVVGPSSWDAEVEGVTYLGRIADRSAVRELFYRHAFFVMPSRFEPLGQVFLEAMSCQLPCIGSRIDAMPELIDEGQTGFLIDPGDAGTLAQRMKLLLTQPETARAQGAAGFRKLCTDYTWPVVGARIKAVLDARLT